MRDSLGSAAATITFAPLSGILALRLNDGLG